MKNVIVTILVLLGVGVGGYFGWGVWQKKQALEKGSASSVELAAVERQTIELTVEVAGDIEPAVQVEVKSELSAKILKLHVELGQEVKTGDLLVDLDNKELLTEKASAEIEIAGTKLELEKARADHERDRRLFEQKLIAEKNVLDSKAALDLADNSYDKSQKRLQNVLDRLAKSRVLAPMGGKILELPVVEGQVVVAAASVNSGTALMKIADLQKLQISTHVNQVDVAKLKTGMKVDFSVDSLPGLKMEGRIAEIAPTATIKKNIKGFTVEVAIDQPEGRLRPGMTADVVVPIEKVENVLAVPLAAVFTEGEEKVAFVKAEGAEAKPEMKEVEIGISNIDFVEIKSGLNEGEKVLLSRPRKDRS
ncbi:MAG: efflux RND transporter periplasmic adaptor subunit [Blastochloris sp.]|nr:efflux RND transporter periplasmic adaptor subunit [Blastochloris sp.]